MKVLDIVTESKQQVDEGPLDHVAKALGSRTAATKIDVNKEINRLMGNFKPVWKNSNWGKPTDEMLAKFLNQAGFPIRSTRDVHAYLRLANRANPGVMGYLGNKVKQGVRALGKGATSVAPTAGASSAPGTPPANPPVPMTSQPRVASSGMPKKGAKKQGPDGQTYTWAGAQWIAPNGQVARRDVAQQLNQSKYSESAVTEISKEKAKAYKSKAEKSRDDTADDMSWAKDQEREKTMGKKKADAHYDKQFKKLDNRLGGIERANKRINKESRSVVEAKVLTTDEVKKVMTFVVKKGLELGATSPNKSNFGYQRGERPRGRPNTGGSQGQSGAPSNAQKVNQAIKVLKQAGYKVSK